MLRILIYSLMALTLTACMTSTSLNSNSSENCSRNLAKVNAQSEALDSVGSSSLPEEEIPSESCTE